MAVMSFNAGKRAGKYSQPDFESWNGLLRAENYDSSVTVQNCGELQSNGGSFVERRLQRSGLGTIYLI